MVVLEVEAGEKDPRVEFLADFTLKSLRLKSDKWARLLISDEMRTYISRFIDHTIPQVDFQRKHFGSKTIFVIRHLNHPKT